MSIPVNPSKPVTPIKPEEGVVETARQEVQELVREDGKF